MKHTELSGSEPQGKVRLVAGDVLRNLGLQPNAEDLMFLLVYPDGGVEDEHVEDGVFELADWPDEPVVVRVDGEQVVEVLA